MVHNDQFERTIHVLNGYYMPIVWGEGLLKILKCMAPFGLHIATTGKMFNWGGILSN
jgi:hypothetical protein